MRTGYPYSRPSAWQAGVLEKHSISPCLSWVILPGTAKGRFTAQLITLMRRLREPSRTHKSAWRGRKKGTTTRGGLGGGLGRDHPWGWVSRNSSAVPHQPLEGASGDDEQGRVWFCNTPMCPLSPACSVGTVLLDLLQGVRPGVCVKGIGQSWDPHPDPVSLLVLMSSLALSFPGLRR